ncbi:MAG: hypothetical protein ACP5UV_04960, partial [Thermoplasmata archaeon]
MTGKAGKRHSILKTFHGGKNVVAELEYTARSIDSHTLIETSGSVGSLYEIVSDFNESETDPEALISV